MSVFSSLVHIRDSMFNLRIQAKLLVSVLVLLGCFILWFLVAVWFLEECVYVADW